MLYTSSSNKCNYAGVYVSCGGSKKFSDSLLMTSRVATSTVRRLYTVALCIWEF